MFLDKKFLKLVGRTVCKMFDLVVDDKKRKGKVRLVFYQLHLSKCETQKAPLPITSGQRG